MFEDLRNALRKVSILRSPYHHWLRFVNVLRSLVSPFLRYVPAGHFYSPLPDLEEIERRKAEIFPQDVDEIAGVDLRPAAQLAFLKQLAAYYPEFPPEYTAAEPQACQAAGLRYYGKNMYFGLHDALVLYGMMRAQPPQRIIEIGSGYSSALMLDTAERFLGNKPPLFTFIEPYPQRLHGLITDSDRAHCTIIEQPIQAVSLSLFDNLEAGDILFVDGTHVAKIGSDVLQVFFEILPRLKPGVRVHFHDILWPFQYPYENVCKLGIAWNEAYFMRAFLQYNPAFRMLYFVDYILQRHPDVLKEHMPLAAQALGCSSLWIEKEGAVQKETKEEN